MALPGKNKISIKEVYDYLMTKPKMTKNKALGIIANINAESSFYSDAVEMNEKVKNKGIGLFQHTYPSRKKAFQEEVPDWKTNWKGQIDFALSEDEAQSYLNTTFPDSTAATAKFMNEFENPHVKGDTKKEIAKNRVIKIEGRTEILKKISFNKDDGKIIVAKKLPKSDNVDVTYDDEGTAVENENIISSETTPEVKITGSNYQTKIYDEKNKEWFKAEVTYNEDKTDYTLDLTKMSDGSSVSKDDKVFKDIKRDVIDLSLQGKNSFKKVTYDDGSVYYQSHSGDGAYQITTPPIHKTNVPTSIIESAKKKEGLVDQSNKKKYRKDILDRVSGRKEYLEYLEDNQDDFKRIKAIKNNIKSLTPGTEAHNELKSELSKITNKLRDKELKLKEHLHKKELGNYVNTENDLRNQLGQLENEVKVYSESGEEIPSDLTNKISKLRKEKLKVQNRVKVLSKTKWQDYDISPVQQGYNQNILEDDGTVNIKASEKTPVLPDPLGGDDDEVIYNVVNEKTDKGLIVEEEAADVIKEVTGEDVNTNIVDENPDPAENESEKQTRLGGLADAGNSLLKGAGQLLDYVGGPGGIISYVMGKKGLKEAMKEVKPHASAKLSPMFLEHLRHSRELSKKGFHPDEARLMQKEIDGAYQKGLENAVRGSGGQRATFLAQSGVLDSQRSSALLQYAAKDAELQRVNADKHEKLLMFKENFDISQTEKERTEDMERKVANKASAAEFTSAAFTNLMAGFGGSSLNKNAQAGGSQFFNQITKMMQNQGNTGTDNKE